MNILHTSDWHIGRALYGRSRYQEYEAFLDWLCEVIEREAVDVLLVAGDVFDSSMPSNRSQELYYRFLRRVAAAPAPSSSGGRHVVIVAGNHDSPSFLNAPKELLKTLNVHVVGGAAPEDEVLALRNGQGDPEVIVCAAPYLRDRDIRVAEAGESIEDKERKLLDGIRNHYAEVAALAGQKREELGPGIDIPIVGMGHLFAVGGQSMEGDGTRDLYVGSLAHVPARIFPACFDYLALGHLHAPQKVNGSETMRYSGSPLPMSFSEAGRQKSVSLVTFQGRAASARQIDVPEFQALERIQGDWDSIAGRIAELAASGSSAWLEIVFDSPDIIGDLRDRLDAAIVGTSLEILRVKNTRIIDRALEQSHAGEALEDLDENAVFERCLCSHETPEDQRPELRRAYQETLASLHEL